MLKILILEDEDYTLRFLKKLISQHPLVNQVLASSSGNEAIKLAGEHLPDIAFLDIELSPEEGFNGIDVAQTIQKVSPKTKFVFLTGYSSYAVESFSVHPYDYILKPIKQDRVINTLSVLAGETESDSISKPSSEQMIIKNGTGVIFINYTDIFFIEKQGKKAFIHSSNGIWETTCSLNELEDILNIQFLRVHKSFIVNMNKISRVIDTGSQSFEIYFNDYNKTALMSRNKFREHQEKFTPSF